MSRLLPPIRLTPLMVLALGLLWLGGDLVLLGKFSVLYAGDNADLIHPGLLRYRYADTVRPLWDNFAAAGSDRQSLGFSLFLDVWLFRYLPGWLADAIRIGSQTVVSALAAYAIARRVFVFSPWTAVFCGLAYVLTIGPGMLIGATFAYYPLLVLAVTMVLDKKTNAVRWGLLVVAVVLIGGTGYFSRIFPFMAGSLIAWFLFVDFRRRPADWLAVVAVTVAIFALTADTTLALKTQAPLSHLPLVRYQPTINEVLDRTLAQPWFLGSSVSTALTALFVYAVVVERARQPRMKGLLALLVIGTFGPFIAVVTQTALLPIFSFLHGFELSRVQMIPALALPFAAGYGFEALRARAGTPDLRRRLIYRGAIGAAVGVLILASLKAKLVEAKDWLGQGTYAHNFESPVLRDLAARIRAEQVPVRAEFFQVYSTYLNAYGIETAGGYQPVFLRRYYEYWAKMMEPWTGALDPDSHELWGVHAKRLAAAAGNPRGWRGDRMILLPHDHLPERRFADLYHLNMLSLANVGYIISRDRLTDDSLEPIREAPKPWSSLTTWEKVKINIRANFFGREYLYIYRNRDVLPRFFSVTGLQVFPDGPATLEAVARATPRELRDHALVEAQALPGGPGADWVYRPLSIKLARYESDVIVLRVEGGPGFLVATNSYSPYWRCTENDRPISLIPVYHAFWGMRIEAPSSTIECRYRSPSLFEVGNIR